MSHVYVTSDWHIGHNGITDKFRKQFCNQRDHDESIIYGARALVTKRDVLFVIGDVTWTMDGIRQIEDAEFPCKMVMIGGNHDMLPTQDYLRVFDAMYGAYKYKRYMMTHIPMHTMELYRGFNIHGHCHYGGPYEVHKDPNYFNAILEFNDYLPVNIREVGRLMEERFSAAV